MWALRALISPLFEGDLQIGGLDLPLTYTLCNPPPIDLRGDMLHGLHW